jgi:hypothetical protein
VKAHEGEYADRGHLARQAWEQYFSPENYWSFILASVRRIQEPQKLPESLRQSSPASRALRVEPAMPHPHKYSLEAPVEKSFQKSDAGSGRPKWLIGPDCNAFAGPTRGNPYAGLRILFRRNSWLRFDERFAP